MVMKVPGIATGLLAVGALASSLAVGSCLDRNLKQMGYGHQSALQKVYDDYNPAKIPSQSMDDMHK